MTDSQYAKCHAIIHSAAATTGAVGGGMAQIPLSDAVPISAAQVGMVIALGRVFDVPLSESAAKSLVSSLSGAALGRMASQVLLGWLPGIGNAINAATAAGITETLGWKAARHFDAAA